jgi:hypothetical protein
MAHRFNALALLALAALASGCTTTANFAAPQQDATVEVKQTTQSNLPRAEVMHATTFGNYEFRATRPGAEPLYGRLPLRFAGGNLALDILFFAPAIFLNIREPFAFYEFDLDQRAVRFRAAEKDPWQTYRPNGVDIAKAKQVFGER